MAEIKYIRIDVGLEGGGGLAARLDRDNLNKLSKAAKSGRDWVELEVEDGQVTLDASKVTYIRVESDETRVGF